jgi:sulfate transporter 4
MHGVAQAQVGGYEFSSSSKDDLADIMGTLEKGESVEITALTEDQSRQAAQILQNRRQQTNPMRAYMRNLQCETKDGEDDASKKTVQATSPLWRLMVNSMPIISWFPNLNRHKIQSDIIAGLTVGVMVIPQGMSYANIAGLDYIYGLYSACIPTFVYAFFGQSRQLAVGPVAMVSLLVEAGLRDMVTADMAKSDSCKQWFLDGIGEQTKACADEYAELAFTVSFLVGVMQILGSIMKLGFLVSFLGHPVTSGFTSGAAIIIGLSQVKYWAGFKVKKSQFVYVTIGELAKNIDKTKFMPLILGLSWLAFLMVNKKLSQKYKRLKLMGPLGPLISCTVGIFLTMWILPLREDYHVSYIGSIPDGLMPLSISKIHWDKLGELLPTAATACLIGYMESVAIGKNLAAKHGYEIDAGQEMMALGLSNLVGGCLSCYPVTGSFSRSAVMNSTGGLTQLGGLVSAIVMFLTLLFLTPLFYFLPQFALAAIVINSIIPLVAIDTAKKLWKVKKHDFVLWVVAFIGTMLLGVLLGMMVAVALSLVIVIYESVRPQISILWRIPGTTIYRNVKQESSGAFIPNVFICRLGSSLYFANAAFVKDMLLAYSSDLQDVNKTEYMVLEMTSVISVDSTAVHVIEDIVSDFRSRGVQVAFAMVGNRVEKTFRRAGLKRFVGEQWFFATVNEAVHYCLRHQHAKLTKKASLTNGEEPHALAISDAPVHVGTEIGFSNDLNQGCTTIFISLVQDVPMIMSDITAVFRQNNITIIRAQIEPIGDKGAKHTYLLKNLKRSAKLTDLEITRVREDLEAVIGKACVRAAATDTLLPSDKSRSYFVNDRTKLEEERIKKLEDALLREQQSNRAIQEKLEAQGKRLDLFLSLQEGDIKKPNSLVETESKCSI